MPIINRRVEVAENIVINNPNKWGAIFQIIDHTGGNASILIIDADEVNKYKIVQTNGTERIDARWNLLVTADSLTMTNISATGRYLTIKEL